MQTRYKSIIAICLIMFIFISAILGIVVFKRNQYLSVFDSDALAPVSYELYFASLPENVKEDASVQMILNIFSTFFVLGAVLICLFTKKDFKQKEYNKTMKKMMVVLLQ